MGGKNHITDSTPTCNHYELELLREENSRLKALLNKHGIPWEIAIAPAKDASPKTSEHPFRHFTPTEKIALFRRLFRGRIDVYPVRWESSKGKSGYVPACGNEWKTGVCQKPRIKCGDCMQRQLLPVSDQVLYEHLSGQHTVGVYPLLPDDTCFFWPSTSTKPTGAKMREDSWRRAGN